MFERRKLGVERVVMSTENIPVHDLHSYRRMFRFDKEYIVLRRIDLGDNYEVRAIAKDSSVVDIFVFSKDEMVKVNKIKTTFYYSKV